MYIAILQDDEIENEILIEWHCKSCVIDKYGWSHQQYCLVKTAIIKNNPMHVPKGINSENDFVNYVKSIKTVKKKELL